MTRQNVLLMWVIKQPTAEGKWNAFPQSATIAAERAMSEWVLMANIGKSYGIETWNGAIKLPEPKWPDLPFTELLRRTFVDQVIQVIITGSSNPFLGICDSVCGYAPSSI